MFKTIVLLQAFLFYGFVSTAQHKGQIKLDVTTGFLDFSESESFGIFLNIDPQLQLSENAFMGLRLGITLNSHTIENTDSTRFNIDENGDNSVISVVPTFDYYWNDIKFRPSLGVGMGSHILASYIEASRKVIRNPSEDIFPVKAGYQFGFLLRGGFDLGKSSRIGLEYNFVPKADIELPDGRKIGTVDNSYLGLSIGFTIGSWRG